MSFWFSWVVIGVCFFGILNADLRYRYNSIYIMDYYATIPTPNLWQSTLFMLGVCVLAGPIMFISYPLLLWGGYYQHSGRWCVRFTPWTREQAKTLFPDDWCFEVGCMSGKHDHFLKQIFGNDKERIEKILYGEEDDRQ